MHIVYPSHHRWFRKNAEDPLQYFTGKNLKKLTHTLADEQLQSITWQIAPLSDDFFTDFTPLYNETIGTKENGIVHDVYQKTLGKDFIEFPYYGLSVYENGVYIGGTIFSLREDRIAYAYRAYKRDWNEITLKTNPAILAEYYVAQFASEKHIKYISHGRDRNPYGLNSAIGLATFKLSVGCSPLLTENFDTLELDTNTIEQDALILEMPEKGQLYITKAYLVTTKENEQKYIQVTKYPEQLAVEIVYRN